MTTETERRLAALDREVGWEPLDELDPDAAVAAKTAPVDAVPTPFPSWTRVCRDEGGGRGLARGWHVTIGAKSGTGKSVLAANIARAAIRAGEHVGFISLEMSQDQLDTRQLAIVSGEAVQSLEPGPRFDEAAYRRALAEVSRVQREADGRIYRSPALMRDMSDIEAAVDFMVHGPPRCRVFIVDYLQLAGNPNDPDSITMVSHRTRQMAREYGVTTIGLSQFNRATFARGGPPTMHDLTGGSAIENDSDQVLVVDHTELQHSDDGWTGVLRVDKNRHGPTTDISIRFDRRTLRMTEQLPDEQPSREVA